jgi:hypothetical protein
MAPMARTALPAALTLVLALGVTAGARAGEEPTPLPASAVEPGVETPDVRPGSVVHLEFTLHDETGAVLDTNRGRTPSSSPTGAERSSGGWSGHWPA